MATTPTTERVRRNEWESERIFPTKLIDTKVQRFNVSHFNKDFYTVKEPKSAKWGKRFSC